MTMERAQKALALKTKQADKKPAQKGLRPDYKQMANAIRFLAIDAVEKANSGHPGMPMGMADVATILFARHMKYNPKDPLWPDRDRFILSAGHGSMLQYALLHLTGYEKMTMEQIKNFRKLHHITPGHPEVMPECGIETTTGPLGQGISNAAGFALAERIMNARFGDDLVDHHTYVIASDGDLMEGISHEACALAGHLKLSKLIVLYDDNGISIDGPTSLSYSDDVPARFGAYGWDVQTIDGHDHKAIDQALSAARLSDKPSIICCKTHIGFGSPSKQDSADSHGAPLGADDIAGTRQNLDWPHEPFVVPEQILNWWRQAGQRGNEEYQDWQARYKQNRYRETFESLLDGDVSETIAPLIEQLKQDFATDKPSMATRKASGVVLEKLVPALPFMIGGSADLTGSVNTKIKGPNIINADNYDGQYIHYGVREHGMAAMMNGMALHGGFIPYGGTFLSFSDYCRPSIRLAALMKQRVIFVMTHDSIGLGEDGPTHQPVEHLAALRCIPDLLVLRPCDGVETAESWDIALRRKDVPAVLCLTRQNLAPARQDHTQANLTSKGGYILQDSQGTPQIVLMATGSEVEIAMDARAQLEAEGIATRLVSMPCMELFARQNEAYRAEVLGAEETPRIAIEAGVSQGWERWLGPNGVFIGMSTFGDSAPYKDLYNHFGLTAAAIIEAAKAKLA